MATLVLTLVGADRAGLVAAVADQVEAHGGNWENSRLSELAGTFAGIIEVSVDDPHVGALRAGLAAIAGLTIVTLPVEGVNAPQGAHRRLVVSVLGNDRAGIVRDVSSTLSAQGVGIEEMVTEVRDAAMAGGRVFEATIVATVAASVDLADVRTSLENLANELQVDVTASDDPRRGRSPAASA